MAKQQDLKRLSEWFIHGIVCAMAVGSLVLDVAFALGCLIDADAAR